MELRGRVALVTGSARRVGRSLALALAGRGMRLAIHYHSSEREALDVVREAEALSGGAEAWPIRADLRRPEAAERLVHEVASHFGALDVLVNSAAVMVRTPLDGVTVEEWDDILTLNLRAPFFCARSAAAVMRGGAAGRQSGGGGSGGGEQGIGGGGTGGGGGWGGGAGRAGAGGAIVNIADLAGLESWPGYIPHGISKAGVIHMTRSLARVLGPEIRVNAIAPGAVLLPESWSAEEAARLKRSTPLRRIGTPGDVAQALLYLLDADYVTGETIVVDGGRHVR